MSRPLCRDVKVVRNTPYGPDGLANGLWLIELENPGWQGDLAGRFAMLRPPSWGFEPLWGRPLSICRALPDRLLFHYQVVGRGTALLSGLGPGDAVTLWGPLGKGFAMEKGARTLMLAGGIGIAPFVEYAAAHPEPGNLSLLFGHRPPLSCYPFADLARTVASESFQDRSPEDIPRFTALMEERMAAHAGGLVLACGPTPFLRAVQAIAARLSIRCQVSLENRMACGVGACLGCVATDSQGHNVQVCTKGPVFWSDQVTL